MGRNLKTGWAAICLDKHSNNKNNNININNYRNVTNNSRGSSGQTWLKIIEVTGGVKLD